MYLSNLLKRPKIGWVETSRDMNLDRVDFGAITIGFNHYGDDPHHLWMVDSIILHNTDFDLFVSIDRELDPLMYMELCNNPRVIQSWNNLQAYERGEIN